MQSFKAASNTTHLHNPHMHFPSSFLLRSGEEEEEDQCNRINGSRYGEIGELDPFPIVFHHNDDAIDDIPRSSVYSPMKSVNVSDNSSIQFGHLNQDLLVTPAPATDAGEMLVEKRQAPAMAGGGTQLQNWRETALVDTSHHTDTSTDVDADDRNQQGDAQYGATVLTSTGQSKRKIEDHNAPHKTLKRLAQNREAARKSRLRKKAYVQQLETSRLKLAQLEQELEKTRNQGMFSTGGFSGDQGHPNEALAFDMDYARWLDEHHRLISELRMAINTSLPDDDLRIPVDGVMLDYSNLFRLKGMGAKSDIFHMLTGMWQTPVERFFMWLGGFRSSEMLKILVSHLEPLTDQQLMGFCTLQQSSQQAEDALSQGMEALQQSLVETLSSACLGPGGPSNIGDYMGQMAIAMTKLATLHNFFHQADLLRQQTLQQLHRILTTRQAARALLVIHDYTSRLRALSALWLARPKS